MTQSQKKKPLTKEDWEKRLKEVNISKSELNKLIMDYFVVEGFKDAAEKFQKESGTDPGVNLSTLSERMAIRNAIQEGNISRSVELLNEFDPDILDTNPELYFYLQLQQLIELIRTGNVDDALRFAQEELAPRGRENSHYLTELERVMSLLAFDDPQNKSPNSSLLDYSQRIKTATKVNAAILQSQALDKEPRLHVLIQMLLWSQRVLESKKVNFPKVSNLHTMEVVEWTPSDVSSVATEKRGEKELS
jgi:hypothetical protein